MTVTLSIGKRKRSNREWVCPKTSGLFLLAATSCMKASGGLPGSTLSISLQPNGSHSSMNRLLYASLFIEVVALPCSASRGGPRLKFHSCLPWFLPPAHTAVLPSDLTISPVTRNLEPNYIIGCVVLWLLPGLNLVPKHIVKSFE